MAGSVCMEICRLCLCTNQNLKEFSEEVTHETLNKIFELSGVEVNFINKIILVF